MLGSEVENVSFGRFGISLDTWTKVLIRGQGMDSWTVLDS